MTSSIDWGYEKLRNRRANNQGKKAEYKGMSDPSAYDTFAHKATQRQGNRLDRQETARTNLEKGGYDFSDLSGYDHKAAGGKKFGQADIKFLQGQGKSDDDIKNYIGSLGADALSENVKYSQEFGGDHYIGDHDRNTKLISDFDTGKGYNKSDIKYLRSQGYTDVEIAEDMVNRADQFGGAAAKFLQKQGRFDDWDAANKSRSEAKERAQEQLNNSSQNTDNNGSNSSGNNNNSGNNTSSFPDLNQFMTPMPGSNNNSGSSNNNSGGSNNNSSGGIDLSQFMTPMGGNNSNSGSNNNYSPGGLDLSQWMMNY